MTIYLTGDTHGLDDIGKLQEITHTCPTELLGEALDGDGRFTCLQDALVELDPDALEPMETE